MTLGVVHCPSAIFRLQEDMVFRVHMPYSDCKRICYINFMVNLLLKDSQPWRPSWEKSTKRLTPALTSRVSALFVCWGR